MVFFSVEKDGDRTQEMNQAQEKEKTKIQDTWYIKLDLVDLAGVRI